MLTSSILVPLLAAVATAQKLCGSTEVPDHLRRKTQTVQRTRTHARSGWDFRFSHDRSLLVDTYMHVVAANETEEGGWIPDSKVQEQFQVLNKAYKQVGIQFKLKEVNRIVNPRAHSWFTLNDVEVEENTEFRKKTRKGGYDALNIYFRDLGRDMGGFCPFPEEIYAGGELAAPETLFLDGCEVNFETVPGGSHPVWNLGGTVPHEVGHWFGLFHTFQDGCSGGDQVDDTPAQARPSNSTLCEVTKDTCPKLPGLDPVHNHMDYSSEACRTEFTPGQAERMSMFWNAYRSPARVDLDLGFD
ncbi:hypothetical protein H072_6176 [Dactylellina haptotyla CBS 200.50]|uniref:Peptidase M43 pregnancy-associated plasma-A domain-containing protein n=1 Tax=Dactylellina haptotyla (strain CBS 200.50) TaxID=1284197 RepID=S8AFT2_DACHA|nr:hypothetical protein H072_6176 [Dactylellina haptotyla CBS 200.50]